MERLRKNHAPGVMENVDKWRKKKGTEKQSHIQTSVT